MKGVFEKDGKLLTFSFLSLLAPVRLGVSRSHGIVLHGNIA